MKRIILLFTLLTSAVFSAEQILFTVENPEMVQAYYNIFSAIADIFVEGTTDYPNDFVNLLRLMFLVGGFFVFASGIFNSFGKGGDGAIGGYIKYLLIGVALLTLVFYKGNTEVWVIAENDAGYCSTAQGTAAPAGIYVGGTKTYPDGITVKRQVPTLLAYAFLFTNRIGTTMTEIAETAYETPGMVDLAPQAMSQAGYMGALKGAMNLVAIDPAKVGLRETNPIDGSVRPAYDMGKAYRAMFTDCVLIPFSAKGSEGAAAIAELKGTSDIHTYLDDRFSATGALAADLIGGVLPMDLSMTYQGEVYNCGDFYANVISPIYTQFYSESICGFGNIGQGAVSLIVGATSGVASEFQDIAVQAGLVSELEGSLSTLGVGVSGVGYASGKTRAEFIQSSLSSGVYMAEMLPYLQMTIRAVLYGFFPFVFVMVLLPGGLKVLGTFFQTIVWVELWSPTAAIINMFMMSHATNKYTEIYGGSGLTMMSSVDMLSTGSTIAGIGGYLYLSVPALTWLIMKGSAQMLGNITGAMGAGMARNITTQAVNQDKALVAKTQEASVRSGKDLSMAEAQHYDAIQGGRMEGAKLGTQMKMGIGAVLGSEVMNESSKLQEYSIIKQETGMTDIDIGKGKGNLNGKENLSKVNAGVKLASGGKLTDNARTSSKQEEDRIGGEIDGDAERTVSKHEAKNTRITQNINKQTDSKLIDNVGANEVAESSINKKSYDQAYNQLMSAGAGSEAGGNFLYNQATTTSEKDRLEETYGKDGAPKVKGVAQAKSVEGTVATQSAEQAVANLLTDGDRAELLKKQAAGNITLKTVEGGRVTTQNVALDNKGKAVKTQATNDAADMTDHKNIIRQKIVEGGSDLLSNIKGVDKEDAKNYIETGMGIYNEGASGARLMTKKSALVGLAAVGVATAVSLVNEGIDPKSSEGKKTISTAQRGYMHQKDPAAIAQTNANLGKYYTQANKALNSIKESDFESADKPKTKTPTSI